MLNLNIMSSCKYFRKKMMKNMSAAKKKMFWSNIAELKSKRKKKIILRLVNRDIKLRLKSMLILLQRKDLKRI